MKYNETPFGFDWGAASVTRCFSDENQGWVTLAIKTPKAELQVYVTKTGKVRVWMGQDEMAVPQNAKDKTQ